MTKTLPATQPLSHYRPMRTITLSLGLSALIAGCAGAPPASDRDLARSERVDALMRDYAGDGPGARDAGRRQSGFDSMTKLRGPVDFAVHENGLPASDAMLPVAIG